MARVSVVIPTYDRAALLVAAVESVRAQGLDGVEIIIADDGSGEDIAAIADSLGAYCVRLPHSGLPAVARNAGVRRAAGELIAFLDSDDLFLPGNLARQVDALDRHPEVGLSYSDGVFFRDDPSRPLGRVLAGLPRPDGDAVTDLLRGNFLFPSVVVVRRECIERAGGFDESPELRVAEDYDLWLRLALRYRFTFTPGDAAAIRRHDGCLSRDTAAIRRGAIAVLRKLERQEPEAVRARLPALHEGYARHHAAVAAEALRRDRMAEAARHALTAAGHALRAPAAGLPALAAWWRRRGRRGGARP
jgi:glycosyltransferase involved in cell wall biosynthesis